MHGPMNVKKKVFDVSRVCETQENVTRTFFVCGGKKTPRVNAIHWTKSRRSHCTDSVPVFGVMRNNVTEAWVVHKNILLLFRSYCLLKT